jgi:2-oxoglutarate ferredoxin oxidoreductase subunit alpha
VLSWGGTYGACKTATQQCRRDGLSVSHAHLRYLHPLPRDLGEIMSRFRSVLIPELNLGQLRTIIRASYLIDAAGYNKVKGKPFSVSELVEQIQLHLACMNEES